MKQSSIAVACLILALPLACSEEQNQRASDVPPGVRDLRVSLPKPEYGYQISSAAHIVQPGEESHVCDVVMFHPQQNEKLFWLNKAESRTSLATHHMNVHVGIFSVLDAFLTKGAGENVLGKKLGQYDCSELGDLMAEQNAFPVYPSQITNQSIEFPPGVALPGIAPLMLVMEHHYINASPEPVLINAYVNFYRVDEAEVEHILTGFAGVHDQIELPPESGKITAWTCAIDREINMVAISSHAHERSDCFTLNQYYADTSTINPEPLYVNYDWHAPPIKKFAVGEWTLPAGDGIHWACHYNNPEKRTVTDGPSANDEMCIFVGVGYPNRLTVADVKAMVADPLSVDVDSLLADAMVACDPVSAVSPYEPVNIAIPGKIDACDGLEEFDSHDHHNNH